MQLLPKQILINSPYQYRCSKSKTETWVEMVAFCYCSVKGRRTQLIQYHQVHIYGLGMEEMGLSRNMESMSASFFSLRQCTCYTCALPRVASQASQSLWEKLSPDSEKFCLNKGVVMRYTREGAAGWWVFFSETVPNAAGQMSGVVPFWKLWICVQAVFLTIHTDTNNFHSELNI